MLLLRTEFRSAVRYLIACGPRCLRYLMLILSGPVELFILDSLMAHSTSSGVMVCGSDFKLRIELVIFLFVALVLCCFGFVKILLKFLAMALECVITFLLNVCASPFLYLVLVVGYCCVSAAQMYPVPSCAALD